ncbi:MAG: hypothetical protein WB441_15315 [Nocardioidaceae bacterium]
MTTHAHAPTLSTSAHRAVAGVAGGVAGGAVFGVLMQVVDLMPMVAQLVGSSSVVVGWVVHLGISAIAGAVFAVGVGAFTAALLPTAAAGLAYGALWWVLGALLVMPAQLGMPVLELNTTAWQSLVGHLLFGLVLGLTTAALLRHHDRQH